MGRSAVELVTSYKLKNVRMGKGAICSFFGWEIDRMKELIAK